MKVYNTLSGQKEEFLPQSDEVKMYVCGVTPYDDAHIGHAMSYIIFDVIRRYLQFRGYKVKYVQNVTDVDDKIIERANRLGVSTHELAEKYSNSFFEDMDALNIGRADIYPRATGEIPKMIEVIQGLVDKGYAYDSQGSVYFRVRNVLDYGKLSHRSLESMMSTEGAIGSEEKESPMDFVLWKAAKPGEPSWESPWGQGRPGWHIECSAMSLKYLGNTLDIHGGGQDLIFPHHENEIAQSESLTGIKPFVKHWLHNGLLQLGEEKMSKSLGNLITIGEALEKYSADALRIFVLSSHYRSPLTYSEEALEAVERGTERLRQTIRREFGEKEPIGEMITDPYQKQFVEAMDDDFNTAQAVAVLFDLAHDVNRAGEVGYGVVKAQQVLVDMAGVLGLTLELLKKPKITIEKAGDIVSVSQTNVELVELALPQSKEIPISVIENVIATSGTLQQLSSLSAQQGEVHVNDETYEAVESTVEANMELRQYMRQAKMFEEADKIRSDFDEKAGITFEDTPKGTIWRIKR
ncbi:cysteine--tRNA ligase [Chloroflexota bacterium]